MIYSGRYYIWTVNQAAIAAAHFPGFPPDESGLEALQEQWANAGLGRPEGKERDLAWAKTAMRDVYSKIMKYDTVPA